MARYILRRLALIPLLLLGVILLVFVLTHLVPADPARLFAGPHAPPEQVETLRREFGLDRPLPQQLGRYLVRLTRGDFGISLRTQRPVLDDLREYFPATLELTIASVLTTTILGILLGTVAAARRGSLIDLSAQMVSLTGLSFPIFFFGLLLQLIFSRWLEWLPLAGRLPIDASPPGHVTGLYVIDALMAGDLGTAGLALTHLALPTLTLTMASLGPITRITRTSVLEALAQDYVKTARAKGLAPRRVLIGHVLRNAMIPVVTVLGLSAGGLLGGVFLAELIFAWPGLGLYSVEGIVSFDYWAIMATAMVTTVIFVLINLLVDAAYGVIDPRIRYEG